MNSYNHDATAKIAKLLTEYSDLPQPIIKDIARRADKCRNRDKLLNFLTGGNVDEYEKNEHCLKGVGEHSMFFTNGNTKIAVEVVNISPVASGWNNDEYLKYLIYDAWQSTGANTFRREKGPLP